jgi:hypothetical protein
VSSLAYLIDAYHCLQAVALLLLLIKWALLLHRIPTFHAITAAVSFVLTPLLELCIISIIVGSVLAALLVLRAGDRLEQWSSFGKAFSRLWQHILVGAHYLYLYGFLDSESRVSFTGHTRFTPLPV